MRSDTIASRKPSQDLFKVTTTLTPIDRTTAAARLIITEEIEHRDAATKRLRALRLARDAEAAAAPPVVAPAKRTRAKKT